MVWAVRFQLNSAACKQEAAAAVAALHSFYVHAADNRAHTCLPANATNTYHFRHPLNHFYLAVALAPAGLAWWLWALDFWVAY